MKISQNYLVIQGWVEILMISDYPGLQQKMSVRNNLLHSVH